MLATPRSLSQPTTSFIASQCQGIRQTPLLCLISRFVSDVMITRITTFGSFRAGDDPRHTTNLVYPFLPLRLGDGARNLDFRPLPINDVKEQAGTNVPVSCTKVMVEADGIEPTTSCLQSRRSPN